MVDGLNFVKSDIQRTGNLIEDVLISSGIENLELFFNPEKNEKVTSWKSFSNIIKAVMLLKRNIKNNVTIGILVDDDADGFTSSAAITKYLNLIYDKNKIKWYFHKEKSHGLGFYGDENFEKLANEVDLLIIPDAASNDFIEQEKILNLGLDLIILDHHLVDNQEEVDYLISKYSNYSLVNNHIKNKGYTNPNFTGAGVVYKFCQAYDEMNKLNFADELLDLIAIGQIADASDISEPEIRLLVKNGIENITSEFVKVVLGDTSDISPKALSFSIIPMINAITRVGTQEEKLMLMQALSSFWSIDDKVVVQRRRKNKATGKMEPVNLEWTNYQLAEDTLKKVKARQNKIVDKLLKESEDVFNSKICILEKNEDEIEKRAITGLVANKLASKYNAPTLVLVKSNTTGLWNGSGRGYEKTIKDFRNWCINTGKFELAQGHDNAFGVEITDKNLNELKKYLEENQLETDVTDEIEVYEIYENKANLDEVRMINDNEKLFGGNVKPPLFGYKSLILSRNSINQRGSVVTFFKDGLEFIAYKQTPGVVDDFIATLGFNQYFKVDLVGAPSRNNWAGRIKEQIVLDDFVLLGAAEKEIENPEENWIGENGELNF